MLLHTWFGPLTITYSKCPLIHKFKDFHWDKDESLIDNHISNQIMELTDNMALVKNFKY